MADITSLAAALGSLKSATELAKIIKNSGASLEQAEIKLQMADLIGALADTKIDLAEVQQILISKDEEIAKLTTKLNTRKSVIWEKPYYFVLKNNDERDGPFCQQCYDNDEKLIRLQGGGSNLWGCTSCKNKYKDKNYKSPQPIRFA
ncbi:hypothetical protein [Thalassotalea sp. PS06]|uniref:hypothetical protein n=1 Tax=Thalassotalea sp. PS06 TaxID=2594005 RepID=UPI001164CF90|nr:hypothetical protein [Thalassotalea sp. PS06]QDP02198.1 hypothetical protein FNC98_13115 [Thalassotalea sp. PS06]